MSVHYDDCLQLKRWLQERRDRVAEAQMKLDEDPDPRSEEDDLYFRLHEDLEFCDLALDLCDLFMKETSRYGVKDYDEERIPY